ncbi:hypothetical protein Sjap_003986 [Stephania japonica]|uniref:Uncharacterized protein n=1 Tax=Stephania japonica TaxID=461633 RepID=A0AAP0PGL6_9MAGN
MRKGLECLTFTGRQKSDQGNPPLLHGDGGWRRDSEGTAHCRQGRAATARAGSLPLDLFVDFIWKARALPRLKCLGGQCHERNSQMPAGKQISVLEVWKQGATKW